MIKQASNKGPNCYVKGEGVVHKKEGPTLKNTFLWKFVKCNLEYKSIFIEWHRKYWLVEEGFLLGH